MTHTYSSQPTVFISSARAVSRSEELVEQFAKEPDAAVGKVPTAPHLYGSEHWKRSQGSK